MTKAIFAIGSVLLVCAVACEMDDDRSSIANVQSSLTGRRCEDEANRACDDARRGRKSDEDVDRAYGHQFGGSCCVSNVN